jgi:hypothetical protein
MSTIKARREDSHEENPSFQKRGKNVSKALN